MKSKYIYIIQLLLFLAVGFVGCDNSVDSDDVIEDTTTEEVEDDESHDDSDDYTWEEGDEVQIVLADNSTAITGSGASVAGNVVTVSAAGTYNFSGSLTDGQIMVNSDDDDIVRLVLNGVDINCSYGSPLYLFDAEKVVVVLTENTSNNLSDGNSYTDLGLDDDNPNAAIFSMTDLTITGDGTLTIDANYNDGIASKDGLIISSGTFNIIAEDDGIRGKDYLIISNGYFTIDVDGVGLKSDNESDESKGYITIEDGTFNINSGGKGIDAVKDVEFYNGDFTISAGGKGISGTTGVAISNGNYTITSDDDAIHSNGTLTINNGYFLIYSDDDGLHADYDLTITDGEINIAESFEGIESAVGDITISGGEIHLVTSDDGLNLAAGGASGGGSSSGNYYLNITGGYVHIDAGGDGIDANANVIMTDGTLIVSGSTESSNSALDYDGSFQMNGGFLVAAGTSRMAEAPSTSSSQNSVLINFSSTYSAGHLINIQNQTGESILTFSPEKSYQSLAFSSSDLVSGSSFDIYLGGSSTGTIVDGVYQDGTYTSGTKYSSFTISNTVTNVN